MKKIIALAACLASLPTAASAAIIPDIAAIGPASKVGDLLRTIEQKTIYLPLPKQNKPHTEAKPSARKASENRKLTDNSRKV